MKKRTRLEAPCMSLTVVPKTRPIKTEEEIFSVGELQKALHDIAPGLLDSHPKNVLHSVVFDGNKLTATSDFICASVPFITGKGITIPAALFVNFVKKCEPNERIEFDFRDEELVVSVDNGSKVASFPVMEKTEGIDENRNKVSAELGRAKKQELPVDFWQGANLAQAVASRDPSLEALTGVFFEHREIFASDGRRVGLYHMQDDWDLSTVLIRAESIRALLPFRQSLTHYVWEEGFDWMHFTDSRGNAIFSLYIYKLEYPDIRKRFPDERGLVFSSFSNPKGRREALNRVASLTRGDPWIPATLEVTENGFKVSVQFEDERREDENRLYGHYSEEIYGRTDLIPGTKLLVEVNPLLKFLPNAISFVYLEEKKALLLRCGSYRELVFLSTPDRDLESPPLKYPVLCQKSR